MKQNYDEIFKRLTTIMYRLSLGEVLSVTELSSELSVHTRTIQRDLNDILKNCFPLIQNKKTWKMEEKYHFDHEKIDGIIQYYLIEKLVESSGTEFYNQSKEILLQIKNKIMDKDTDDKNNELPEDMSHVIMNLFEQASRLDDKTHNILTVKRDDDVEHYIGGYTGGKFIVFSKKGILHEYDTLDDFYAEGWIIG